MSPWTQFSDMHSGGGQKLQWGHVFIEAPEDEARKLFAEAFGRDPDNVTCACCGPDYAVYEDETLEGATLFHRKGGISERDEPDDFDAFLADPHFTRWGERTEVKIVRRPR